MSALKGTVALTCDPSPALLRASWMFFRAGNVVFR